MFGKERRTGGGGTLRSRLAGSVSVSSVARVALSSLLVAAALGGSPAVAAADCSSPNPIVVENCKAGSPQTEWDVAGAGSAGIQGFATDISVDRGETVQFKVDTPASAYRLEI